MLRKYFVNKNNVRKILYLKLLDFLEVPDSVVQDF